ncbi:MAG: hypothetical protein WBV71_01665 [Roseobacter sp.]
MKLILARLDLTYLTACVEDTGSVSSSRTPSLAELVSLREVTRTTNNPDVVLLSSSFSEAGTSVIVGVGPQRARCIFIGYIDGKRVDIQSLTDKRYF